MADGGSVPKQIAQEAAQAVQTSVVEPLKDEMGKIIEAAGQSVMGTPQPTQQQQEDARKKADEEQRLIEQQKQRIDYMNRTDKEMARVRQENAEKEEERKKAALPGQPESTDSVAQFEVVPGSDQPTDLAVTQAQNKTEIKGIGG